MNQKILLFGLIIVLAVGVGVWAFSNSSNQVPTVNLTATNSNTTSGSANNAASSNNAKTTASSSSSNNANGGSSANSTGSSSSSSSSDSNGGWVNVVPSNTNPHSENST
jgi:hypothetical protein